MGLPSVSPCTDTTNQYPPFTARMEYMPPTAHRQGFSHSEPRTQRKGTALPGAVETKTGRNNTIPRR